MWGWLINDINVGCDWRIGILLSKTAGSGEVGYQPWEFRRTWRSGAWTTMGQSAAWRQGQLKIMVTLWWFYGDSMGYMMVYPLVMTNSLPWYRWPIQHLHHNYESMIEIQPEISYYLHTTVLMLSHPIYSLVIKRGNAKSTIYRWFYQL